MITYGMETAIHNEKLKQLGKDTFVCIKLAMKRGHNSRKKTARFAAKRTLTKFYK